jgi:hypothetical protein
VQEGAARPRQAWSLRFSRRMQNPFVYELVGYIASVLIAVSVMNTNVLRLRIFNVAGAAFFTAYGFLIEAWPVAGLNLFIVVVNSIHNKSTSSGVVGSSES